MKRLYFRIIALTVAVTLFFESAVYGMELGDVRHLRVPLTGTPRIFEIYERELPQFVYRKNPRRSKGVERGKVTGRGIEKVKIDGVEREIEVVNIEFGRLGTRTHMIDKPPIDIFFSILEDPEKGPYWKTEDALREWDKKQKAMEREEKELLEHNEARLKEEEERQREKLERAVRMTINPFINEFHSIRRSIRAEVNEENVVRQRKRYDGLISRMMDKIEEAFKENKIYAKADRDRLLKPFLSIRDKVNEQISIAEKEVKVRMRDEAKRDADYALDQGDYQKAIVLFNKALDLIPEEDAENRVEIERSIKIAERKYAKSEEAQKILQIKNGLRDLVTEIYELWKKEEITQNDCKQIDENFEQIQLKVGPSQMSFEDFEALQESKGYTLAYTMTEHSLEVHTALRELRQATEELLDSAISMVEDAVSKLENIFQQFKEDQTILQPLKNLVQTARGECQERIVLKGRESEINRLKEELVGIVEKVFGEAIVSERRIFLLARAIYRRRGMDVFEDLTAENRKRLVSLFVGLPESLQDDLLSEIIATEYKTNQSLHQLLLDFGDRLVRRTRIDEIMVYFQENCDSGLLEKEQKNFEEISVLLDEAVQVRNGQIGFESVDVDFIENMIILTLVELSKSAVGESEFEIESPRDRQRLLIGLLTSDKCKSLSELEEFQIALFEIESMKELQELVEKGLEMDGIEKVDDLQNQTRTSI